MEKIKFNYRPDREMLSKALEKAKKMNIAINANEILNFMVIRSADSRFQFDFNPENFKWNEGSKPTTAYLYKDYHSKFSAKLHLFGLRTDNTFICNLLLYNFLHKF